MPTIQMPTATPSTMFKWWVSALTAPAQITSTPSIWAGNNAGMPTPMPIIQTQVWNTTIGKDVTEQSAAYQRNTYNNMPTSIDTIKDPTKALADIAKQNIPELNVPNITDQQALKIAYDNVPEFKQAVDSKLQNGKYMIDPISWPNEMNIVKNPLDQTDVQANMDRLTAKMAENPVNIFSKWTTTQDQINDLKDQAEYMWYYLQNAGKETLNIIGGLVPWTINLVKSLFTNPVGTAKSVASSVLTMVNQVKKDPSSILDIISKNPVKSVMLADWLVNAPDFIATLPENARNLVNNLWDIATQIKEGTPWAIDNLKSTWEDIKTAVKSQQWEPLPATTTASEDINPFLQEKFTPKNIENAGKAGRIEEPSATQSALNKKVLWEKSDIITPTNKIVQADKIIKDNIPNSDKLSWPQLLTKSINLQRQMWSDLVPDMKATTLNQFKSETDKLIDDINNTLLAKTNQEDIDVQSYKAKIKALVQDLKDWKNLNDAWDARSNFDNNTADAIKKWTSSHYALTDTWHEVRNLVNDYMDNISEQVWNPWLKQKFSDMSSLYEANNNIAENLPLDAKATEGLLGKWGKIKRWKVAKVAGIGLWWAILWPTIKHFIP